MKGFHSQEIVASQLWAGLAVLYWSEMTREMISDLWIQKGYPIQGK